MIRFIWLALFLGLITGCAGLKHNKSMNDSISHLTIEKRWTRHTPSQEYLGFRKNHRFTPILTDKYVIQGNAIDGLNIYDRRRGHRVWHYPVKNGIEAGAQLVDNVLYFAGSDAHVHALDIETKRPLWTYPLRSEGLSTPYVRDGRLYVLAGNNILHALDTNSGERLWTYNRREATSLSIRGGSRPNVYGNIVYTGFSDGYLVALDKDSGALVWETLLNRNRRFRDVDAHPTIDGDKIYISSFDDGLYCLNLTDGSIAWSLDKGGYSSILLEKNAIYYSTSGGEILAIDKRSGQTIWNRQLKSLGTSPVKYKNFVAVGEFSGAFLLLDAQTGQLAHRFEPGRGVTSRPVFDIENKEAYFISADANLFALRLRQKNHQELWPWEKSE